MDLLTKILFLLVGGLVLWGVWRATLPPQVFAVRIVRGKPFARRGTVTPAFVQQVEEVAAGHGVVAGWVWGEVVNHGRIRLKFSAQFPATARQRLRNWWAEFGWVGTPRRV